MAAEAVAGSEEEVDFVEVGTVEEEAVEDGTNSKVPLFAVAANNHEGVVSFYLSCIPAN